MDVPSGLSLFLGADLLLTTLSGEVYGRLYGGDGGDYIYQASNLYKIHSSGVSSIYGHYPYSITNIFENNEIHTVVGMGAYNQRFIRQRSHAESLLGWTLTEIAPSGVSVDLLSDDGLGDGVVPVLTGNRSRYGNRVDRLLMTEQQSVKSDTGLPSDAILTDLEAAI